MVAAMRPVRRSTASIRKCSQALRRNPACCSHSARRAFLAAYRPDLSDAWRIDGKMREMGVPVLGDLQPRRHPDALMFGNVIEKPHQGGRASGTANHAAMQAYRHHLRRSLAFGV